MRSGPGVTKDQAPGGGCLSPSWSGLSKALESRLCTGKGASAETAHRGSHLRQPTTRRRRWATPSPNPGEHVTRASRDELVGVLQQNCVNRPAALDAALLRPRLRHAAGGPGQSGRELSAHLRLLPWPLDRWTYRHAQPLSPAADEAGGAPGPGRGCGCPL